MKLLFTQDALLNAGAERSHLEILSRFSPDVEVLFVYFYPKHDLKEEYQDAGIRLHFLDIPESYHFPLPLGLCPHRPIDIPESYSFTSLVFACPSARRILTDQNQCKIKVFCEDTSRGKWNRNPPNRYLALLDMTNKY